MLTMYLYSLKMLRQKVKEMGLHENTFFDLCVKVTANIAQYPLHHLTHVPVKFEGTMSSAIGEDVITRNYTI